MSSIATVLADVRQAIELLVASDSAAATRTAAALDRWMHGETLEQALALPTDWRMRERIAARDAALQSLVALHPDLSDKRLAERIVAGVARASGATCRPGGEAGYLHDLSQVQLPGGRQFRRLIADIRRVGHQGACNGQLSSSPSARNRRHHGFQKQIRRPKAGTRPPRQALD